MNKPRAPGVSAGNMRQAEFSTISGMLKKPIPSSNGHSWRFFRAGGLEQVRLETGADIANLAQLDPKLWVALACPAKGLEFDEKTLGLIDADNDGRIRVPEILAAVKFCREHLKSLDVLVAGSDVIELSSFNEATPAGAAALASAREVLKGHGRDSASTLSLADVADTAALFANALFNGDGVLTAETAGDPQLKQVFADILATVGGTADKGGAIGVAQADMDAFHAELAAYDAWVRTGEEVAAQVLPLGDGTAAAALAVAAVKAKVDDYFARCRLAAFDARALAAVNRSESEYLALAAKDLTVTADEIKGFPLARVEAGQALPLAGGVNPAWAGALAKLAADAAAPILGTGKAELTEGEWAQIQDKLSAHMAWAAGKPSTKVETLGLPRIRAILASGARDGLAALIARDKACEAEFNKIADLEKLLRLHRDLFRLLHNFTSFTDFYSPERWSVFQSGTLYLDNRSCDLVLRVEDAAKHGAMAHLSKCYLAYCDCTRPGGAKMSVVAVFSGGDSDYLMVGRNGLFFDRKGQDWDATITKVVDNPISIRQAFFSPYKKFVKMVDDVIAKRAAAADAEANAKLAAHAEMAATTDKAAPVPPKKIDLATVALIGAVVSGMAALVGGLLQTFFGLGLLMPLGIAGIVLLISGPSMLIAAMKLRQRTMAPILEANGWAINGRVKVNIPFGGSLTKLAEFPANSVRSLSDPYEQKKSPWWYVIAIGALALTISAGVALCYQMGCLPESAKSQLRFMGVPLHLKQDKVLADAKVDELTKAAAPAVAALAAAKDARIKIAIAPQPDPKLVASAQADCENAEAALKGPQEKLDAAKKIAASIDKKIASFTPPVEEAK